TSQDGVPIGGLPPRQAAIQRAAHGVLARTAGQAAYQNKACALALLSFCSPAGMAAHGHHRRSHYALRLAFARGRHGDALGDDRPPDDQGLEPAGWQWTGNLELADATASQTHQLLD